jgi:beta-galactosidase
MSLAEVRTHGISRLAATICALLLCLGSSAAWSQKSDPLTVDASAPFVPPAPAAFREGSSVSPTGGTLGINGRYLTLNGTPWLPVVGELQFSRVPESQWEEEILKMKAGGVQVVGTYLFWIHHEEIEGQFDWTGQRDLRHFIQLCAAHGMYVYPRIGPWAHGEARNGGFPDWLMRYDHLRTEYPVYMRYVARYYQQIGDQMKGLLWKDGGPVIGIQLENEYTAKDREAGDAYILALKRMAIASGMDVPLYTVTGWGSANVPPGEVMAVYGGYPDAPWDRSLTNLPPTGSFNFHLRRQASLNMGMLGAAGAAGSATPAETIGTVPVMTVEMGGGVQDTYHRRPALTPDDVAALMPVAIGSGVNVYGTYIFQGGENPDGKLSTLQESRATGYATDVPVKSYDFQAPLSEFGEERESFRKVKTFNYFLNDFGKDVALGPKSDADPSALRFSVRTRSERGYVFVNNYVRGLQMADHKGVRLTIKLPNETLVVPEKPVDIPSGAYFIWPFNLALDQTTLRYSTAQLLTKTDARHYFFFCLPGIRCDFAFKADHGLSVQAPGVGQAKRGDVIYLEDVPAGSTIALKRKDQADVLITVLSQQDAENAWKIKAGDGEHLLISSQSFYGDGNQLTLESFASPKFSFRFLPAIAGPVTASLPLHTAPGPSTYTAQAVEAHLQVRLQQVAKGDAVPQTALPGKKLMAPGDPEFAHAARWSVGLPANALTGLSDVYLQVNYTGDVARLTSGGRLLTDDFYNGKPWRIGLKRFAVEGRLPPLELSILPFGKDAPMFIEDKVRAALPPGEQVLDLRGVAAVPVYKLVVDTSKAH